MVFSVSGRKKKAAPPPPPAIRASNPAINIETPSNVVASQPASTQQGEFPSIILKSSTLFSDSSSLKFSKGFIKPSKGINANEITLSKKITKGIPLFKGCLGRQPKINYYSTRATLTLGQIYAEQNKNICPTNINNSLTDVPERNIVELGAQENILSTIIHDNKEISQPLSNPSINSFYRYNDKSPTLHLPSCERKFLSLKKNRDSFQSSSQIFKSKSSDIIHSVDKEINTGSELEISSLNIINADDIVNHEYKEKVLLSAKLSDLTLSVEQLANRSHSYNGTDKAAFAYPADRNGLRKITRNDKEWKQFISKLDQIMINKRSEFI